MKKLYNHKKTKVHPSPQPATTTMTNHLYLLPLALATLAATLPPQDKQVLAYLISTTTNPTAKTGGYGGNHAPEFGCNCFTCYTSYWAKWDESPNQQLIHDIIEKYEDGLVCNKKNKKARRRNKVFHAESEAHAPVHAESEAHAPPQVEENKVDDDDEDDGLMTSLPEKGSVKKIVNFLVGRIWGVWGI
ncbi:hypothetical protein Tco_1039719 [Tanacetum coccineum]